MFRKLRKFFGFRCFYQELRQLQIQSCIPKAGCLDRGEDGEDDDDDADDADASDHGDNDVDAVACPCTA